MTQTERTFFIIKPDGVVIPEVYSELFGDGELGLTLEDIGTTTATEELLREHYAHIADKPFFKGIVNTLPPRDYLLRRELLGSGVIGLIQTASRPILPVSASHT